MSPRARTLNDDGVGKNWRFSTSKPPYLRNGARYDKARLPLITDRKSNTRFRLVPKSTTLVDIEMTLDGNYALCCIHTCASEPTTKIFMKIDPYYQRQKCSPGILLSSKVSFMGIFTGVRWSPLQRTPSSNESGVLKMAIFFFRSLYLPNLHI